MTITDSKGRLIKDYKRFTLNSRGELYSLLIDKQEPKFKTKDRNFERNIFKNRRKRKIQ